MPKFKDLTGERFGRLVVLSRSLPNSKQNKAKFLCMCDCGQTVILVGCNLIQKKSRSCGCFRHEVAKSGTRRIPNGLAARNSLLHCYKQSAKRRGYEWELSESEFNRLIKQDCHYCGEPPCQEHKTRHSTFNYNGLDRKNNKKGYYLLNLVPCCGTCNIAKASLTVEQFTKWVSAVYYRFCLPAYCKDDDDYCEVMGYEFPSH